MVALKLLSPIAMNFFDRLGLKSFIELLTNNDQFHSSCIMESDPRKSRFRPSKLMPFCN